MGCVREDLRSERMKDCDLYIRIFTFFHIILIIFVISSKMKKAGYGFLSGGGVLRLV